MSIVRLGSYSVDSQFAVTQHRYIAGETGYRHALEVIHPDGTTKFVMHERGEEYGHELHRFSEWETLQDAKAVVEVWPDASEKVLRERQGFKRFVDLEWHQPWFYAGTGREIDGDRLKPIICDGCNVRPPHEHRCHGKRRGSQIGVRGEMVRKPCECGDCPS